MYGKSPEFDIGWKNMKIIPLKNLWRYLKE
jgi:hypothetical protein